MDLELESVDALGEAREPLADAGFRARSSASSAVSAVRADSAVASSTRACTTDRSTESSSAGSGGSDLRGDLALRATDDGATRRLGRGIPLPLALPLELHDPRLAGSHALLERLDVEPCAHLDLACRVDGREHAFTGGCIQDRPRRFERGGETVLRDPRRGGGVVDRGLGLSDAGRQAFAFGDRGLMA